MLQELQKVRTSSEETKIKSTDQIQKLLSLHEKSSRSGVRSNMQSCQVVGGERTTGHDDSNMSDEEDTKKVIPDQEIHQLQPHCHRKMFALPIFFVAGTAENLWQILPGCSLYSDTGAFWRENNSLCDQPVKTWDRNLRSREMFCHFFIPHVCCSFLILIVNKQMDNNFDTPCVNGANTSGLF